MLSFNHPKPTKGLMHFQQSFITITSAKSLITCIVTEPGRGPVQTHDCPGFQAKPKLASSCADELVHRGIREIAKHTNSLAKRCRISLKITLLQWISALLFLRLGTFSPKTEDQTEPKFRFFRSSVSVSVLSSVNFGVRPRFRFLGATEPKHRATKQRSVASNTG